MKEREGEKDWVYRFFFFKQKTAYEIGTGDWSSDVCSSDLFDVSNLHRSSYSYCKTSHMLTRQNAWMCNLSDIIDRKSVV